jgi:predicted dehydrogenase
MTNNRRNAMPRRQFIETAVKGAATSVVVVHGFPTVVSAAVFGRNAPSNRINVGAIGTGRISRGHDMPGLWKFDSAQITAVCDLDRRRVEDAKKLLNEYYSKKTGRDYRGVTGYDDYRELLKNRDIDAVVISTPDHWHALIGIHAVEAGKDVYLQKPASLTITEGRALSNAVQRTGRILQIGSQQRSSPQFRYAAELVRNGRIGQLKTVYVGLPVDPAGDVEPEMPVPRNLNYETWLGSTPYVYYTEKRVHPQNSYDRPGWLRCEQFGAGMITGWGAHHIDSAHWAMGAEFGEDMITRRDTAVAFFAIVATLCTVAVAGQKTPVMQSSIFDWNSIPAEQTDIGAVRHFFQAPTATLDELECHVTTVSPGATSHPPHQHPDEELVIMKEGTVEAFANGETKTIGPGSIIFCASNQLHGVRNIGKVPATYFAIRWTSPGTKK